MKSKLHDTFQRTKDKKALEHKCPCFGLYTNKSTRQKFREVLSIIGCFFDESKCKLFPQCNADSLSLFWNN